jgi:hypothetical protein
MGQHKTVRAPGDGRHGHARLANGGDHLGQADLARPPSPTAP